MIFCGSWVRKRKPSKQEKIITRLMMGGSIVIMLLFLINGIFRGAGDAMMALKSLWIAIFVTSYFVHSSSGALAPYRPLE
jgi:hypothetical protein